MKNTKKFAAMIAALTLSACSIAPMVMTASAASHTVNITANDEATHTYAAYQIFSGTYTGGVLTDVEWAEGVNGTAFITALQADNTLKTYFADCATAQDVADALGKVNKTTGDNGAETSVRVFEDDSALAQAFAKVAADNKGTSAAINFTKGTDNYSATLSSDGYYLVMDTAAPTNTDGSANNSGAYTRYILKVAGDETINITAKSAAPTVDKTVQDETGDAEEGADANGYGESADHEMFEKFNFNLKATLPASTEYAAYETYKVVFEDTMSNGVTFSKINSVTVDGQTIDVNGYTIDGVVSGEAGKKWTLTIDDIKAVTGVDLSDGADIVVNYEAWLNENAIVSTASDDNLGVSDTNNNKVKLHYSNNPNASGSGNNETGETPEDYVWVFTYESFNKKTDESGNPLAGAEFKLYSDENATTEIGLIYDTKLSAYRPVKADETATAITSAETTGVFNIVGLDNATYYLKETKAPAGGYNLLTAVKPFTIDVTAHKENANGTSVALTLAETNSSESNPMTIENKKGSSLPSTGGIGTKIFYLGGGAMVAVAGVFLITKKRMGKSEN